MKYLYIESDNLKKVSLEYNVTYVTDELPGFHPLSSSLFTNRPTYWLVIKNNILFQGGGGISFNL